MVKTKRMFFTNLLNTTFENSNRQLDELIISLTDGEKPDDEMFEAIRFSSQAVGLALEKMSKFSAAELDQELTDQDVD